jgi:hypothetical protein
LLKYGGISHTKDIQEKVADFKAVYRVSNVEIAKYKTEAYH